MAGPVAVGRRLRAEVPDGIFNLGVEVDDETAAAEHAAFAERAVPAVMQATPQTDAAQARRSIIDQLAGLRRAVAATGIGYLGVVPALVGDRPTLVLLSVAGTPMRFSMPLLDPASMLATALRQQHPEALVEQFQTPAGDNAVGLRRLELMPGAPEGREVAAGVCQVFVPFANAGLLATVIGYTYSAQDIDLAAVLVGLTACKLRVVGPDDATAPPQLEPTAP